MLCQLIRFLAGPSAFYLRKPRTLIYRKPNPVEVLTDSLFHALTRICMLCSFIIYRCCHQTCRTRVVPCWVLIEGRTVMSITEKVRWWVHFHKRRSVVNVSIPLRIGLRAVCPFMMWSWSIDIHVDSSTKFHISNAVNQADLHHMHKHILRVEPGIIRVQVNFNEECVDLFLVLQGENTSHLLEDLS